MQSMRIDKWLWAARWHKTRALAQEALDRGQVQDNGPASQAQQLYAQTPDNLVLEAAWLQARQREQDPGAERRLGRPTKRERRDLDHLRQGWGDRWQASWDEGG